MNARPEASPVIVIGIYFEGGVDVALGRGAAEDLPRVVAWLNGDELRRRIVLDAAELQARAGVTATDAQLAALADALRPTPKPPDPLDAVAPMGSLQGMTLRRALALGDVGREWVRWAAARPWPLDPEFREAVLEVARREGLLDEEHDDAAGTP